MASLLKSTMALLLFIQLASGVFGQGSPMQGLQSTTHQIVQLEDVKLEAISAFLTALLTMIALIPQGIMQAIEAKIHFDAQLLESLMGGGVGTNGSPQASMDFINRILHNLSGSSSSGSSSGGSSGLSSIRQLFNSIRGMFNFQHSSSASASHSSQSSVQHSQSSSSRQSQSSSGSN